MTKAAEKFRNVVVRKFQPGDRDRIREICQDTAARGRSPGAFLEDPEITSMYFADYYMDYEPESCFVAELDGRIIAYLLASKDTEKCMKILIGTIGPKLVRRMLWKIITLQYRRKETYQTIWWIFTRSWREMPRAPIKDYPAHFHWNINPEVAGQKLGILTFGVRVALKLLQALGDHFREAGVRGVHGITPEREGDDTVSRLYCRIFGAKVIAVNRLSLPEKLTGQRWYAKLLVLEL